MLDRNKGILLALGAGLLYGTIPIFGKVAVTIFSPLFVTFIIPALVTILFGFIFLIKKEKIGNLAKKESIWIVVIGFLSAMGSLFSFKGLSLGQASDAGFLLQLEVLFSSILAYIFLKEKLVFWQIIGIILMILGVYFFTFEKKIGFNTANILFLLASFAWGINTVIVRGQLKRLSPLYLAFGRYFVSVIILFWFSFSSFPNNLEKITIQNSFLLLSYATVIVGLVLLFYSALKYIKAAEVSSLQLVSPIATALISIFFLGEHLAKDKFIGGTIILFGLFLMIRKKPFKFLQ